MPSTGGLVRGRRRHSGALAAAELSDRRLGLDSAAPEPKWRAHSTPTKAPTVEYRMVESLRRRLRRQSCVKRARERRQTGGAYAPDRYLAVPWRSKPHSTGQDRYCPPGI
eukprot:scaffold330_cov246-Pinguiococcus_pyrenoidosus.AAC.14